MVGDLFFWSFCCLRLWRRDKKVRLISAAACFPGLLWVIYSIHEPVRAQADRLLV